MRLKSRRTKVAAQRETNPELAVMQASRGKKVGGTFTKAGKPATKSAGGIVGVTLTDEEIRKAHAGSGCECPVCYTPKAKTAKKPSKK